MVNISGSPNSCIIKIGKQRYRALVDTDTELKCDGCITVQFCIGGTEVSQEFYVFKDLNRNFILGFDWLKKNNVRIYFDLKYLRING